MHDTAALAHQLGREIAPNIAVTSDPITEDNGPAGWVASMTAKQCGPITTAKGFFCPIDPHDSPRYALL